MTSSVRTISLTLRLLCDYQSWMSGLRFEIEAVFRAHLYTGKISSVLVVFEFYVRV